MVTRRTLLTAALLAPFAAKANLRRQPKLAVLDWGLTEMLLALDITPAAVAAPAWYRRLIPTPVLPPQVVDLGLLFQPNMETLWALKPDAIVITAQHALLKPALEQIAPTLTLPTHTLAGFTAATRQLGAAYDCIPRAESLVSHLQHSLDSVAARARAVPLPLFLATAVDALHLRLYTGNSLPGSVLSACGLRNAWTGAAGAEGSVMVELTAIASTPARLILLAPDRVQQDALHRWQQSLLWQQLPLTSSRNLDTIADRLSDTGALITAGRFAMAFSHLIEAWRNE